MEISEFKGINIGAKGEFVIDPAPSCKAEHALITHAHSDHVSLNKKSKYFLSEDTKHIIESVYGSVEKSQTLPFGKKIQVNGCSISLHNSGHILGASQVLVEKEGETAAITSDFKLQDSLFLKGAEILKSDVLVVECTFGLPCFSFPEREKVYAEMGQWIKTHSKKGLVVLAGYSVGKAQELTAISNQFANISPLVHESIFNVNEVYRKRGVKLGDYIKLNHNLNESSIVIMPPSLAKGNLLQALSVSAKKKVFSALSTGWSYRNSYNKVFPLSDHADFSQLLEYVKESRPKLVLTMHGFEKEFAGYVQRRLKIPARPLSQAGQKMISEF